MDAKNVALGAAGLSTLALILHAILKSRNRPAPFQTLPMGAGPGILSRMAAQEVSPPAGSPPSPQPVPKARPKKKAPETPFCAGGT